MAPDDLNAPLGQDTNARSCAEIPGRRAANAGRRARAVRPRGRGLGDLRQRSARRRADRGGRHRARRPSKPDAAGDGQQHSRHDGPPTAAAPAMQRRRGRRQSRRPAARPSPSSTAPAASSQDVVIPGKSERQRAESAARPEAAGDHAPRRDSEDRAGRHAAVHALRASAPDAAGQRPTRRASPSSSAGSASAHPAPPMRCRQTAGAGDASRSRPTAPISRSWRSARAAENHEVLLQAPMEPFDYPDNDPGPQTLLTSLTRRPEYRPAAVADEPLPGLCRDRQLHGRALHRVRARRWRRCCARPPSAD